jgi:hypothetical protein
VGLRARENRDFYVPLGKVLEGDMEKGIILMGISSSTVPEINISQANIGEKQKLQKHFRF